MEIMKGVPIGVDNFKKIRDVGGYYVDKTDLISDIVARPVTEVFLFTRPRRFGKSLNMSMLDAFFSVDYKGNDWFDGLKVTSDRKSMEMMNSFPVSPETTFGRSMEEGFLKSRLKVYCFLLMLPPYTCFRDSTASAPKSTAISANTIPQKI